MGRQRLGPPDEAGLGAFVRPSASEFRGRSALLARRDAEPDGPARRLRTVRLETSGYVPVYGGEAVRIDGAVVGRLRSAGFGHGVMATLGTVYLPGDVTVGQPLEIDVFDRRVPALVAEDVLVDPDGSRMRA